jgi:uncharacterized membrane protein YjjP (DUF1212 family)
MCNRIDAIRARAEEVAHLSLVLGRYLLISGADTARVQDAVERFAGGVGGLGFQCHLLVQYEALLLTVISGGEFRTKVGAHVAAMAVDMSAVRELYRIADDAAAPPPSRLDIASAKARLSTIEPGRPIYPRWVVAGAMGLTAASLARLFGGDASVFVVTFFGGTAAILVQQQLRRVWGSDHSLAVTFASALTGALVGGLGMRLHPGVAPELCLIAPGMILVPGVPLINAISDAIHNNISLALERLTSALLAVAAIALGLFAATMLTGVAIPTSGATPLMPIAQDMAFSALAAIGFTFLFNVPWRLAWACIICGLCSHSLRTALMHAGCDIASGTLIGSMAAGFLAHLFARRFGAPPATFAFPGVVAMMPGSYAFRAVVASLQIMRLSGSTPPPLLAQTLSLVVTTIVLTAAIAVGLAIPLSRRLPSAIKAQPPAHSA